MNFFQNGSSEYKAKSLTRTSTKASPKNYGIRFFTFGRRSGKKARYNDYFGVFELSELATDAYNLIEMTLREEYGVPSLDGDDDPDEDSYDLYSGCT